MGAGIAATLIKKHGCTVIGVARSEAKMLKFIDELGADYAKQFSYKLFDVSVKENWENFAEELKANGTKIDILINNAGILPKFKRFDRYSYEEIENAMNINFYSCVYSTKTLLPMILESSTPAIVNIDSSAALMTLAGTSMYSASKAALKGFTEALRVEFAGKMYVGLVCPGFTKTDIFRNQGAESNDKGAKVMNMISTDCDLMVKMIMRGIEFKVPMQVHGLDAHAMSVFNRMMPVYGSKLFSSVMRMANVDIFKEVFKD
jgi:short-subunit dehydrogenase